jgi:hypothetical protein
MEDKMKFVIDETLWKEVAEQLMADLRQSKRDLNMYAPTLPIQSAAKAREEVARKKLLLADFMAAPNPVSPALGLYIAAIVIAVVVGLAMVSCTPPDSPKGEPGPTNQYYHFDPTDKGQGWPIPGKPGPGRTQH